MTEATNTLHVVARLRATAGREKELEELLLSLIPPTRAEQGCRRYELTRNSADEREFVFIEEWTSAKALDEHLSTPHLQHAKERFAELLDGGVELLRLDPIA